jgi:hypothetical protein
LEGVNWKDEEMRKKELERIRERERKMMCWEMRKQMRKGEIEKLEKKKKNERLRKKKSDKKRRRVSLSSPLRTRLLLISLICWKMKMK